MLFRSAAGAVVEGTVVRTVRVGFEARVEIAVVGADGAASGGTGVSVEAVLTRAEARTLGLGPGTKVWLRQAPGSISIDAPADAAPRELVDVV